MRTIGLAQTAITTMVPTSTTTGWSMTQFDQARQKGLSAPRRPKMRSASTRGPSTPSTAGSRVRADSTEKATTMAPPTPIERSDMYENMSSPDRPTITAMPLKKMARPACATVVSMARATSAPCASSSRKRPTMNSE